MSTTATRTPASAARGRIGTAGWSLPASSRDGFAPGTHQLQRYASRLDAVEINSSFYRPHARRTYAGWSALVPDGFRFSVKLPRTITQHARLEGVEALLDAFLAEAGGLGRKLGRLLVQLPPSLAFDAAVADAFFASLRERAGTRVRIACEPRHASWDSAEAGAVWATHRVARVAADPPRFPGNEAPAGPAPPYFRWHGSPRIYHDPYSTAQLRALADQVRGRRGAWVIFDNTTHGHATANALALRAMLDAGRE
ncbi:MAG: DUF72 domain-containing protein [Lysobacteraceae bacterium]|nr:MAG: DUF72 domain-containing protein [Xanthomonadaceae bacterium]